MATSAYCKAKNITFEMMSKLMRYDSRIKGFSVKNKIKNKKSMEKGHAKSQVSDITPDDPSTGKIQFKIFASIISLSQWRH